MKVKSNNKKELDIVQLFSQLLKNRIMIFKITFISFVFGIIYSLLLTNIYEASSTFYPHYEKKDASSLSNLAGLAGISISDEFSTDVPKNLYPNLLSSAPFKNKILNEKLNINDNNITYREYLSNKKISIVNFIFSSIIEIPIRVISYFFIKKTPQNNLENLNYISLSQKDYELHKVLDNLIKIELNEKDGYIKLKINDENPVVAAQIAKKSEELLQESIINYKLKNLRSVYDFTLNQFESSKKVFYKLQDSLANFRDRNKNIKSDLFLNQLNRLESEYNIANTIYSELALNKERTAIEIKKNTPIFTILNPVTLPIEKSYPKRKWVVLTFTMLGFIFISLWVVLKTELLKLKNEIFINMI